MSMLTSGLQGVQDNVRGMVVAAQNLANMNTEGYRAGRYASAADPMPSGPRAESGDVADGLPAARSVDVAGEAVALQKYTYGVRANALVIRTANELEGRLLDVFG